MNSISNARVPILDSRQIVEGVAKAIPIEREGGKSTWAEWYVEKLNYKISQASLPLLLRCSKRCESPFLCSWWMSVNEEGVDLHFISRSVSAKVGDGTFKKVKDVVSLRIFKESPKNVAVPSTSSVIYRVKQSDIAFVRQGLKMHKKTIESCGQEYFAEVPVVLGEYTAKNGEKKMEMLSPRYIGDMESVILEGKLPLSILDKVELCLDVAQGTVLLGQSECPIVHRDLKSDNILLTKNEEGTRIKALIADFDRACHPTLEAGFSEKFRSYISFLTSQGRISVKSDAYSLAILVGETLLSRFSSFILSNFGEVNVADRTERQMGLGFFTLDAFKKKVSLECAKKVEELFLGKSPIKELLLYSKSLRDAPESSLVKEFAFELAVFKPVFGILLRALKEEQKTKEMVLEQEKSIEEADQEFHPPNSEEIVLVLEKCKETLALLQDFLEEKIGEEELSRLEMEDPSFQGQRLHPNQLQDLMQKALLGDEQDQILEAEYLAENINAYLDFAKQEHFSFRFKKGSTWGAGFMIPFSGAFIKDDLGISLYCIPGIFNENGFKDGNHSVKKVVSAHVPVDCSLEASSLTSSSLCVRVENGRNAEMLAHKTLMTFAKNHIVPYATLDLTYQGKLEMKRELYDSWSQGSFLSELSTLNVEQKIDICLDVLSALRCLHENGYVHRNIRPENILLRFFETRKVEARLSDFRGTTRTSLTEYKSEYYYWNLPSRRGYACKESDLYGLVMVIGEVFLEISPLIIYKRNLAEQALLESVKKRVPSLIGEQIQQIFDQERGYGESFSEKLRLFAKEKNQVNIEQFALESLLFPSLFDLFEKMVSLDNHLEMHVRSLKKELSKFEWQQILSQHSFPNREEICQVLENGKARLARNLLKTEVSCKN